MANFFDQFDAPQRGGNFFDQFDATSVASDIGQTILPGIARGIAGVQGAAGSIDTLARGGANFIANQLGFGPGHTVADRLGLADTSKQSSVVPPTSMFPTTGGLLGSLESVTGPLYQPQTIPGKIVNKTLEFAPAALGGGEGIAAKVAMAALPAAASTLAGEATKGTPLQPWAEAAGALIAPGGAKAAAGMAATRAARRLIPTTEELYRLKTDLYNKAHSVGIQVKPEAYRAFADDLVSTLQKAKYKLPIANKMSAGVLQTIYDDAKSLRPQTLGDLHSIQELIGDVAGNADASTARLGKIMYSKLQSFKRGLKAGDMAAPTGMDPAIGVTLEREADRVYSQYKKSQVLDGIFYKAKNRAANYTEAGEETGIRQKFRALADEWAKPGHGSMRWFTEEERQAIEKVARGGPVQNFVRSMGKFSLNNSLGKIIATGMGSMGYAAGGPIGAAVAGGIPLAVGEAFKRGSKLWTKANASRAADLIRGGARPASPSRTQYPAGLLPLSLLTGGSYRHG